MTFIDPHMPDQKKEAPTGQVASTSTDAMVDKVLEFQKQLAMTKALTGAFGGQQDSLGNTVVNKSIEAMEKQNEKVQAMATQLGADVNTARAETDKAKESLYAMLASQIGGTMNQIEKMRDEIKHAAEQKPPTPRSLLEQLDEAKKVGLLLNPQPVAGPVAGPAAIDPAATMAIEKMRMDHERQMKQLDIELAKMNQELQFRLAEFTDKKIQRKEEFEASNAMKGTALNAIGDMATAAAAALKARDSGTEVAAQAEMPPEPEIKAFIKNFPCQGCGEKVTVPPEGKTATCPSCNIEYELNREEKTGV